ncbi:MAG TPA: carboxypeptidase-like regulatory domain-containing protein [Candidatus Sulfotelmatobacter sp.]|nr:carboxypeptidase-like regulatory domain-containing protein [Candidatus Sulfotelmatobacter sp.]
MKGALIRRPVLYKRVLLFVALLLPFFAVSGQAQSLGSPPANQTLPDTPVPQQPGIELQPGNISGTVLDKDGAVVTKAEITLATPKAAGGTDTRRTLSDNNGYFSFPDVRPGPFELTIVASGFAPQKKSDVLQPGQTYLVPRTQLVVATEVNVQVTETQVEVAEEQIHVEETQRVLGVFPNYYVSYDPNAVAMSHRQKFELAWKANVNPYSFGIAAAIAGIEQADNAFSGYGQGAQGYAKRFGATYADFFVGTLIGGAILPSVLKQDPRYFYKGTGTRKSRFLYAMANAVICKGDNGKWQPNYSSVLGSLAAGGISNLYYPAKNRNGLGLTFENALIGIGGSAFTSVFQEFFSRRLTPHAGEPSKSGN